MHRVLTTGLLVLICGVAGIRAQGQPPKLPADVEDLRWWLPPDTETAQVAQTPAKPHGPLYEGMEHAGAESAGVQPETSCPAPSPDLDRLAEAIEHGNITVVRTHLEGGADVNQTWRDSRSPMLCRSLLLRSIWYGQEEIFRWLLQSGADPRRLPRESLNVAVRDGHVETVRTLLALGLKPLDNDHILRAGLESQNLAMLDLLLRSGVSINPSTLPPYYLTDDITRFLVPKHLEPNDRISLSDDPCGVQELFGLLRKDQDGCEWTIGPLWLHFVVTGRHAMVQFLIKSGADLRLRAEVWDGGDFRPFTAIEVAAKRKDTRMMDLLRRAGAPAR